MLGMRSSGTQMVLQRLPAHLIDDLGLQSFNGLLLADSQREALAPELQLYYVCVMDHPARCYSTHKP